MYYFQNSRESGEAGGFHKLAPSSVMEFVLAFRWGAGGRRGELGEKSWNILGNALQGESLGGAGRGMNHLRRIARISID